MKFRRMSASMYIFKQTNTLFWYFSICRLYVQSACVSVPLLVGFFFLYCVVGRSHSLPAFIPIHKLPFICAVNTHSTRKTVHKCTSVMLRGHPRWYVPLFMSFIRSHYASPLVALSFVENLRRAKSFTHFNWKFVAIASSTLRLYVEWKLSIAKPS